MPEGIAEGTNPAGDGQNPGSTPPAGNTNSPAPADGRPPQAPAPANGGQPDDARQRGILADLQKERRARQELENRVRQHEADLAAERRRVQALAGVTPSSPEDAELQEVRQQFARVFPGLAKLTDQQIETLLQNANQAQTLQQTVQHHWESHGRSMLDSLTKEVSDAFGGELSERQIKSLSRAYIAEAESDPEFLARHERGDKALLKEFAKQWTDDWFEPARRHVTAATVNQQRRVPSGRDRTVQTTPAKAIDFKNPKAVEDAMVESFKSHGGRFGD